MGNNLNRYLWIIDTLRRYGRISRQELDRLWSRSAYAEGATRLPRRTFYNYREAISQMFGIEIRCNPGTYEYYIADDGEAAGDAGRITSWLLDSAATTGMLQQARDIADRMLLEEVPSAREHLAPITDALRGAHPLQFDYQPYTRKTPQPVTLEPYFLRIFRQLWYVTGRNAKDGRVKTYALDRMSRLQILTTTFTPPADAITDPREYFRDSYGIIVNEAPVHTIVLRVEPRQAKYFRALPLHASQREEIADTHSIFTYRMRITDDLVGELLSHGPRLEVLAPRELRSRIASELTAALNPYTNPAK